MILFFILFDQIGMYCYVFAFIFVILQSFRVPNRKDLLPLFCIHIGICISNTIIGSSLPPVPGADPGFQARGGALKKNRAERREAQNCLGYFV